MKYPHNRQGMARRLNCRLHFNPVNGRPHTPYFLWFLREYHGRRPRRVRYATRYYIDYLTAMHNLKEGGAEW